MVSFELGKEIEKDVSRLVTSVGQGNDSESPWGVEHASRILLELRIFSLFHAREKTKTSISISLSSSKLTICHILFYKYDATDTADLSSLLDACHIDFVIDLAHRSCCCSVVEHRSTKSEDLMFDSSLELRLFSLSHARDKTKNIFLFIWVLHSLFNRLAADLDWQYRAVDRMWYKRSRIQGETSACSCRYQATSSNIKRQTFYCFFGFWKRSHQVSWSRKRDSRRHRRKGHRWTSHCRRASAGCTGFVTFLVCRNTFRFPLQYQWGVPDEMDVPLGTIALGKALKALGKEMTFIASYYHV